jgi:hypothetical protein
MSFCRRAGEEGSRAGTIGLPIGDTSTLGNTPLGGGACTAGRGPACELAPCH